MVSPLGIQASFAENQRVLDSQVALKIRSSFVAKVVLVLGCTALGGGLIGLIAKLLTVTVTVDTPGTPETVKSLAVLLVPEGNTLAM